MNLFINERIWDKYAETIAIEDICELCNEKFCDDCTPENCETCNRKICCNCWSTNFVNKYENFDVWNTEKSDVFEILTSGYNCLDCVKNKLTNKIINWYKKN